MLALLNALQAGNRSGTGVYTARLAAWLPRIANDLEIRSIWPSSEPLPCPEQYHAAFLLHRPAGFLRRILFDQFGFCLAAKRMRADIAHYPANIGPLLPAPNAVVTVHDLSFLRHPEWFRFERASYYRLAVGRGVRHATRVIAVSQATASDLVEILRVSPDRIDVIPNGVDECFQPTGDEEHAAVRQRYGLPPRFFLYLGTLEPRKNLVRLILAYEQIAASCPIDLVLAGRNGWKTGPIHAQATRSAYAARIHFPGFVRRDDLPAMMGAADAFVYPSLFEGFGIPVTEAMACGTPVLTSNTSSLPEVAGEAALLVDPYDIDAIAKAMQRLAEDERLRGELTVRGNERAARFTWRETARRTLETYSTVASC